MFNAAKYTFEAANSGDPIQPGVDVSVAIRTVQRFFDNGSNGSDLG